MFVYCVESFAHIDCYSDCSRRRAIVYVFVGFWDWDYVSQLPYEWYYAGIMSRFPMLVRNASPRGPMCFRCLVFNLSGPYELLFLLCLLPLGPEL